MFADDGTEEERGQNESDNEGHMIGCPSAAVRREFLADPVRGAYQRAELMLLGDVPRPKIAPRPAQIKRGERQEHHRDRGGDAGAGEESPAPRPQQECRIRRHIGKPVPTDRPAQFLDLAFPAGE